MVAGVAQMSYARFASYNIFGGIFWVCSMTAAGFYLGSIPWVHKNLEKVVLLIVFLSVLPIGIEYLRSMKRGKQ